MLENKIWFEATTSVLNERVKFVGDGQKTDFYRVGDESSFIQVAIQGNKILSCDCKQHSTKDIHLLGFCSASLAVLFYKMLKLYTRLLGEVEPI